MADLIDASTQTANVFVGGFRIPFPGNVQFFALDDDLKEDEECLLLVLSFNEDDLDDRDKGLVDLVGSVALVRIEDFSTYYLFSNLCLRKLECESLCAYDCRHQLL